MDKTANNAHTEKDNEWDLEENGFDLEQKSFDSGKESDDADDSIKLNSSFADFEALSKLITASLSKKSAADLRALFRTDNQFAKFSQNLLTNIVAFIRGKYEASDFEKHVQPTDFIEEFNSKQTSQMNEGLKQKDFEKCLGAARNLQTFLSLCSSESGAAQLKQS